MAHRLVLDGNLGASSTLGVDGGGDSICGVAGGGPRHGRRTSGRLQVDSREDSRASGQAARRAHTVNLKRLRSPDELSGASSGEGCARNVCEGGDIVVAAAAAARECDDTVEGGADGDFDGGGVVSLAADEVPRRDGVVGATTSRGGAELEHGLENGITTGGLDGVECEDSLAVVGCGGGGDSPGSGE